MDKEKYMVGKIILAMFLIALWAGGNPQQCLALSLSLDPASSNLNIGAKGASAVWTSDGSNTTWTVTNNNSGVTENFAIKWEITSWAGSPAASAWTSGASSASNVFVLKALPSTGGSNLVTSSNQTLFAAVANNDYRRLGLELTTPTGGEQGSHTLTITLTAVAFGCGAGGYANTYCWYLATTFDTSCDATCASHGGAISGVTVPPAVGYDVCFNITGAAIPVAAPFLHAPKYLPCKPTNQQCEYDMYGTYTVYGSTFEYNPCRVCICPCVS